MADSSRYRSRDSSGRRSPPLYNPARASMPVTSSGYSSLYSGDLHAMSASHHEGLVSRPPDEYRTSAVPVSTTTYAVRKEPVSRGASLHDGTRVHRIIEQDSRRPIIVTTKHNPSGPRSGSPSRDPYRSSDEGQYYAQPASSIPRSRVPPHSPVGAALDEEEYQRLRDRTQGHRIADPYRSSRPGSFYAGHHHRSNTLDFDDVGYEYTKPSDLARYDLDHDRPSRPRRESLDRYYRPTVSIPTDLAHPYEQNERRPRGPPPTTRGLDKVNRAAAAGIYDGAGSRMPLPPSVPLAPDARRSGMLEAPGSPTAEHRGAGHARPVSLIQDNTGRPPFPSFFSRETFQDNDGRQGFSFRFQNPEDLFREMYFQDNDVTDRGFGIRVDSNDPEDHSRPSQRYYRDEHREHREPRKGYIHHEPRRRSDDDLEIIRHEYDDRDRRRHRERDDRLDEDVARDRKDARSSDDEPDNRKDKIRDKVAAGLGVATASLRLGSAVKGVDDKDHKDPSPSRRNRDDEAERRKLDEAESRSKTSRKEPLLGDEEFEIVEHPRDREKSRHGPLTEPSAGASKKSSDTPASQPPRDHSSSTDDGRTRTRRRPRASSFNPNDTAALAEMRARLADLKVDDAARRAEPAATEEREKSSGKDAPPQIKEPSPERKPPPPPPTEKKRESDSDSAAVVVAKEDERSNCELGPPERDERQVRVVSPPPPKEAAAAAEEKKPLKGILKQPRAQFPEEPHPVREGVAPHKDDKSKANVPPGARWTKISRKMVNPEALRVGKERFEVRDDFVIVLRVLSKEEIQAYAAATATLRERRRKEYEREMRGEAERGDDDRDEDEDEKKRRHRQHQHRRDRDRDRERDRGEDDDRDRRERDRERERDNTTRHRRRRHDSDDDYDEVGS